MAARDVHPRREAVLFATGVVLVAANLRPAVCAVPPILPELRHAFSLGELGGTVLVTLPVACFGVLGLTAPRLATRHGEERVIAAALAVLAAATAGRALAGPGLLLAGTAFAAASVGVVNVLLSSMIKRRVGRRAGAVLGAYMLSYAAGVLVSTGTAVPLLAATGGSARWVVGGWALLAALALAVWSPQVRHPAGPARAPASRAPVLHRRALAWQVTGFMGAQAWFYYAVISFLPEMLRDRGATPGSAGAAATAVGLGGLAVAFPVPALAARTRGQGPLLLCALGASAAGVVGLAFAPPASAPAWALLAGAGMGASQLLALYLSIARTDTARDAARLSGMSQGVGYLIALLGPLTTGLAHSATAGWSMPVLALLAVLLVAAVLGWSAARPRTLPR